MEMDTTIYGVTVALGITGPSLPAAYVIGSSCDLCTYGHRYPITQLLVQMMMIKTVQRAAILLHSLSVLRFTLAEEGD